MHKGLSRVQDGVFLQRVARRCLEGGHRDTCCYVREYMAAGMADDISVRRLGDKILMYFDTCCHEHHYIYIYNSDIIDLEDGTKPFPPKPMMLFTDAPLPHQKKIRIYQRMIHDDVIKWKHFPRYWPFVRGIHRSPVNSPHKGQWRGASIFSLICVWINGWVNNGEAGDLRRYQTHYDVIVMCSNVTRKCNCATFITE